MLDAVLFDLDGTLLPMDQEAMIERYMGLLAGFMANYDYEPKKLVNTIWESIGAMMADGTEKTNETVFWEYFRKVYGPRADTDRLAFEEFYATEFGKVRTVCGFNPEAGELIRWLKERGVRLILATQPVFPEIATMQRIRWAGLDPADFELVTTYENARFTKPNPAYYREILEKADLEPENCLMVGNDGREDTAAERAGIEVFLLTDCLLREGEAELNRRPHGTFRELREFLTEKLR